MDQEIKDQQCSVSGSDQISLHVLCEEDFPWLLLWMTKEDNVSLSELLQTTKGRPEIIIITGIINAHERISLLTVYAAAFTQLKTACVLQPGEYSIQSLQLNRLIHNNPVLGDLLTCYLRFLFTKAAARKIFWEINHIDKLYIDLAQKAGFRKSPGQDQLKYTLYECERLPGL
jgi:hypothetical protein